MSQNRRRILVAGAAGALGEGICAALLDAGHEVHGLDRDTEGLTRLTEDLSHGGHLHPHAVDLTQPPMLAPLIGELFELDLKPSAVVSCLGRFWDKGKLCDQEYPQELHGVMHSSLVPHLIVARHTVPRLRSVAGARYLMINGGMADLPEPDCGLTNLSCAAQRMLALVLSAEEEEVEVGTLQLGGPVRSRKLTEGPDGWMDAWGVGEACRRLLEGDTSIDGKNFRARDAGSLALTGA